jgi:DNA-binding transcriptional LysR family regulator
MDKWAGIDEFVAVAQDRSFTQAARRLQRSTSQLSRDIGALEDRLGQRLLYRTTRHVSLTENGAVFLAHCRRLQEERDEAVAVMLDRDQQLQGQVRMTCSVAYGERFVAPIIHQVLHDNPRLQVELILTDEVLDLVHRGIDLAVRFGRLRDSRLVVTRLASRTRLLCASRDYVDIHGAPSRLEDLANHICLRGTADTWAFQRDGKAHLHRPTARYQCNSGQAVLGAALAGLGLCQLPDFYLRPHIASGELIELLADNRPKDEGVWAVYPHRRHLPAKVKVLIDSLQGQLAATAS